MQRDCAHFAAAKQLRMHEELRLLRTNNPSWSETEWRKNADSVFRRHEQYFRTELLTANASASMAENWHEFQRRKDTYPNLKYVTAADDRVRPYHRKLDGAVYHIDHPFWLTHYPPNGWRCRCTVIQTDEPENHVELSPNERPDPGFRHNVGITGRLFSSEHAYFDWTTDTLDTLHQSSERLRAFHQRPDIVQLARELHAGQKYKAEIGDITISARDISQVEYHYHPDLDIKNALLPILDVIIPMASFISTVAVNDPRKPTTIAINRLYLTLMGIDFWLKVREVTLDTDTTVLKLYAISSTEEADTD